MGGKKKMPWVKVITYPNGYGLEYEGMKHSEGFMYYSLEKLLEGFMLHIGLEKTEQLDTETMQDFIATAMNWKDNRSCVEEIDRLNGVISVLRQRRNGLATRLVAERNRVLSLTAAVDKLARKYKDAKDISGQLKAVTKSSAGLKPYTVKQLGASVEEIPDEEDQV